MAMMSLRTRFVGSIAVLSALGLFGAGVVALTVERVRIEDRVESSLARQVEDFVTFASAGEDPSTNQPFADTEAVLAAGMQRIVPDDHRVHLGFLSNATIVPGTGASGLDHDAAFRRQVTARTTPGFGVFDSASRGQIRYAVMPLTKQGQRGWFVAAYFLDTEYAELADAITSYLLAALVTWVALVAAAWLTAGRVLRPIRDLTETSARITAADASGRIEVQGSDEVADLGRTVNHMLDRLDDALGGQRRMLDDAGHELRTPITVIRGHLELMDENDPADVTATRALAIDELDRMSGFVEELLVLAKARRPDFLRRAPVDVADVVRSSFVKAQALAPRQWVLDPLVPLTVVADARRLTQALLQLASNAVAATQEGDVIGFGAGHTPTGVQLWVRDTGPGVPPELREEIFTRFRSGQSRGSGHSTGLGLAIVRAIAEAHGGSARVVAASASGGAMFVIELPDAASAGHVGGVGELQAAFRGDASAEEER